MNDADLTSISDAIAVSIKPLSEQLNSKLDTQCAKMDRLHDAQKVLADRQMQTDGKVEKIFQWLDGPTGMIASFAAVQKTQEECGARRAHKAEQTGQWQAQGAKRVKSDPPRSDLAVQREKTRRERIKLAAIVIGIVAGSGAGGAGLLQLLTPAQASQPAAQAP